MPDENVMLGIPTTRRRATADAPDRVELDDGSSARFDPADERAGQMAEIVDGLAELGRPVYLEVDGDGVVTALRIPHVARVERVMALDEGSVAVQLELSHARHVLRRDTDGFAEMEALLRRSVEDGSTLVVTEDDSHRIIDVRPSRWDVEWPPPPERQLPRWLRWVPRPFLRPTLLVWRLSAGALAHLLWLLFPISATKARQVFDAVALLSCHPTTVPPPCIPFMYPDDGCWGRAHEMCRLMKGMSVRSRKVWIEGWLTAATRNNPQCEVHWGWHVAPIVRVRRWWIFGARTEVIDPALFGHPVSQATWKSVQGDPTATLTPTSADIFMKFGSTTDPDNSQTEGVLATYRMHLKNRALSAAGPPPYAHCPI